MSLVTWVKVTHLLSVHGRAQAAPEDQQREDPAPPGGRRIHAGGRAAASSRDGSGRVPDCAQVRFSPEEGPRTCRSPDTAAALGWKLSPMTRHEPIESHSARDFRRDLQNKTLALKEIWSQLHPFIKKSSWWLSLFLVGKLVNFFVVSALRQKSRVLLI